MDFMALLGPLMSIGSSLLGNFLGNTENSSTSGTSSSGATTLSKDKSTTNLSGTSTNKVAETTGTTASGTQTTNQTGNVQRLDATTQNLLTQQVRDLLAGAGTGSDAINQRIAELGQSDFDTTGFVNGIMTAATSAANSELESGLNQITSASGGSVGNNSASALLANKLRIQQQNALAGVKSEAEARAAEIQGNRSAELAGLNQSSMSSLSALLQPLLAASEVSSAAGTVKDTQAQNTTTNTNQTQTQQQKQTTKQAQQQQVAQTTTAQETTNKKKSNWEDTFSKLSKGFTASFNSFPAG